MSDPKWYVVRVVSGKEKKVKLYLESEIEREKLKEFIPQVLIPSEKVYEMRNGKKRVRAEYTVHFAYMLREPRGTVRTEFEQHRLGLFPRETWLQLIEDTGCKVHTSQGPGNGS